jgi:hypothetical protein
MIFTTKTMKKQLFNSLIWIMPIFASITIQSPAQNTGPTSPDHISLIPGESVDYRTGDFYHSIPVVSIPVNDRTTLNSHLEKGTRGIELLPIALTKYD